MFDRFDIDLYCMCRTCDVIIFRKAISLNLHNMCLVLSLPAFWKTHFCTHILKIHLHGICCYFFFLFGRECYFKRMSLCSTSILKYMRYLSIKKMWKELWGWGATFGQTVFRTYCHFAFLYCNSWDSHLLYLKRMVSFTAPVWSFHVGSHKECGLSLYYFSHSDRV